MLVFFAFFCFYNVLYAYNPHFLLTFRMGKDYSANSLSLQKALAEYDNLSLRTRKGEAISFV